MKTIIPKINNIYSCSICGLSFIAKPEEEFIISENTPICSSRCVFKLYYNILSTYDKKDLFYLGKLLKIENYDKIKQNVLIFEVTKKYPKPLLSYINKIGTRDKGQNLGTNLDKGTNLGTINSLCNKELSLNVSVPNPILNQKEDYSKWF